MQNTTHSSFKKELESIEELLVILVQRTLVDGNEPLAEGEQSYVEQATTALLELLEGLVPPEINVRDKDFPKYLIPKENETWEQAIRYEQGHNDCRTQILTSIREQKDSK